MSDQPNLSQIMNLAQKVQKSMQDMQGALANKIVIGKAGASDIYVTVHMTGEQQVNKIEISDAALQQEKAILTELLATAFNSATAQVKDLVKQATMDIYKNSGMPFKDEDH